MITWADTILSEARTGKLECTVHDDYKEEEKKKKGLFSPCLTQLFSLVNLKNMQCESCKLSFI